MCELVPKYPLFFVDDSLVFLKAVAADFGHFKAILKSYEKASGQCVNVKKSTVFFSKNVPVDSRQYLCNVVSMNESESMGVYLGLLSTFHRGKTRDFQFLLDKVWSLLQGWKSHLFSPSGKEVLIKSIIQAIPTYAMGCFRIPKGILYKIPALCARFWWASQGDKRKMHWRRWEELCKPKEFGGLNFRDLVNFNQAMLAKQAWRVLTNPHLTISKVLRGRYFPNSSVLEASNHSSSSHFWKGFVWGRDLMKAGIRKKLGNGQSIKLFRARLVGSLKTEI